ncbi:MAG: hypothetical protein ISS52_02785 [Dehalococcoidia bacterium]|nr:hypothetical protein [Dehalococcoidia bacterium]
MDDTQASNERHDNPRRRLWTYAFLGLIIGGSFLLRRRNIKKQRERANEERVTAPDIDTLQSDQITQDSRDVQSQLAELNKVVSGMSKRLEELYRELKPGWLTHTGIGVTGVGIAFLSYAHVSATTPTFDLRIAVGSVITILLGYALIVAGYFLSLRLGGRK